MAAKDFTPRARAGSEIRYFLGSIAIVVMAGSWDCAPRSDATVGNSDSQDTIRICVIANGVLAEARAITSSAGDTLVDGIALDSLRSISPPYAAHAQWFEGDQPIWFEGYLLSKYGPPRIIEPGALRVVGSYQEIPIFRERVEPIPEVVYVPVQPGCVFQIYQVVD